MAFSRRSRSCVAGLFAQPHSSRLAGEELEKATRALTAEEQAVMDTDIVGKTGQKRRIEVRCAGRDVDLQFTLRR